MPKRLQSCDHGLRRFLRGSKCISSFQSQMQVFHISIRVNKEAITLAQELHADQLLLDETDARKEAVRRHLPFIGTLGILRRAARLNMIDLMDSLRRLQQTTFYVDPEIIQSLLEEEKVRKEQKRST